MPLQTFPSPKKDPRFFLPNKFGIPDDIFNAIVRQSQIQIDDTIETELSGALQLTDGANISTDASLAANFYITLAGNRTMDAPTNPSDWKIIKYFISQDIVGSRTLTWDGVFRFSTDIPSPTLTTTISYSDYVEFMYNPVHVYWDCIRVVKGFPPPP